MSKTLKMQDGDLFFDSATGKASVIDGAEKLYQDVSDVLMTALIPDVTSRSFEELPRNYGNELATISAPHLYSGGSGKSFVSKKIDEAITRLISFQGQDPDITPEEQIKEVRSIKIDQLTPNDFLYQLDIACMSTDKNALNNVRLVQLNHQPLTGYFDPRKGNGAR